MNKWEDPAGFAREAAKVESRGEAIMLAMMWPERDGWTCVTQYPIEPYRIDIAVPEARVAVEVNSFGAHGSAKAMAHDAKRRTVLALQGWDTVELPSEEVFLRGGSMLIERVLPMIARRLQPKAPMLRRGDKPRAALSTASTAAYGRALLATLADEPRPTDPPHLSASQRAFANRRPEEYVGLDLIGVVLDCPEVLWRTPAAVEILARIDGPVALATSAIRVAFFDGCLDVASFLRSCPAIMHTMAVDRLSSPVFPTMETANDAARVLVGRLEHILNGGA